MPDPFCKLPIRHDAAAVSGQRMGGSSRSSDGAGRGQSCPLQPGLEIIAQIVFAAKEMWHAGDVGHQPIHPIGVNHRGIAPGLAAQCGKCHRLSRKVGRAGGKIGIDGAGIGQSHAAPQTPRHSGQVQAMQMIGIARPQGQGKWPLNGTVPHARVAREPRKPYRKQPTCHSSSRFILQKFLFCSY